MIFNKEIPREKKIIFGLIGLVLVSLLSVVFYKFTFTADQEDIAEVDLLAKIAKNVTKIQASKNMRLNSSPMLSEDSMMPYMYRDDGYYKNIYTVTAGPAIDKCNSYNNYDLNTGDYVTNINKSYQGSESFADEYKVIYNGDTLDTYSLTNAQGDYYTYIGGKYAVVNKQSEMARIKGLPLSEPIMDIEYSNEGNDSGVALPIEVNVDIDEDVENSNNYGVFGEDAKLIGTVNLNNVEAYLIEYPSVGYCNNMNRDFDEIAVSNTDFDIEEQLENNLIIRVWVDVDNYEYLKQETYYKKISDTSLISTETFVNEYQKVVYSEVQKEFEFPYSVDIREITYPDVTDEFKFALDFAKDNAIKLFKFEDSHLEYIYSEALYIGENTEYYYDKDFYPNTKKGLESYNEAVQRQNRYPEAFLNTNYSNKDQYYSITYYESTLDEILNSEVIYGDCENTYLKIDGVNRTVCMIEESETMPKTMMMETGSDGEPRAVNSNSTGSTTVGNAVEEEVYEDSNDSQVIDPDGFYVDDPIDFVWKSYDYIFKYGDLIVHISSNVEINNLTTLNLQNATIFDRLYNEVKQSNIDMDDQEYNMDKPMPL